MLLPQSCTPYLDPYVLHTFTPQNLTFVPASRSVELKPSLRAGDRTPQERATLLLALRCVSDWRSRRRLARHVAQSEGCGYSDDVGGQGAPWHQELRFPNGAIRLQAGT